MAGKPISTFVENQCMFILQYLCLIVIGQEEIASAGDDKQFLRFALVVMHSIWLIGIHTTTLSHHCDPGRPGKAGGIVLIVFGMMVASTTCILLMLLFTSATIATIIIWIWIPWIYSISSVIVQRWSKIIHQMFFIDAVLRKRFKFSVFAGSPYVESRVRYQMDANYLPDEEATCLSRCPDRVVQFIFICLALRAFYVLETSDFRDNFVENHIILVRLLFISVQISLLLPVLATALMDPPGIGCLGEVVLMALQCFVCVSVVNLTSTISAIITCILWVIVIFIVVMSSCCR